MSIFDALLVAGLVLLPVGLTGVGVAKLKALVVAVDYRLAPETQHPGPVEDCYAALKWVHESAATLGVDTTRVAIGGSSAGGGLTAALGLLTRDRAELPFAGQVLVYPMLDDRTGSSSDPCPYPDSLT